MYFKILVGTSGAMFEASMHLFPGCIHLNSIHHAFNRPFFRNQRWKCNINVPVVRRRHQLLFANNQRVTVSLLIGFWLLTIVCRDVCVTQVNLLIICFRSRSMCLSRRILHARSLILFVALQRCRIRWMLCTWQLNVCQTSWSTHNRPTACSHSSRRSPGIDLAFHIGTGSLCIFCVFQYDLHQLSMFFIPCFWARSTILSRPSMSAVNRKIF